MSNAGKWLVEWCVLVPTQDCRRYGIAPAKGAAFGRKCHRLTHDSREEAEAHAEQLRREHVDTRDVAVCIQRIPDTAQAEQPLLFDNLPPHARRFTP